MKPGDVVRLNTKSENGEDYVVHVQRPGGIVVQILIPVEGEYEHCDNCLGDPGCTFGLNFITKGHYM